MEIAKTKLEELSEFICKELSSMKESILNNYSDNMANRENNPFLAFENSDIKKYMALGRSVDSQLGNRIQRIIFYISRMRYGAKNVPNIFSIEIIDNEKRNIKCTSYYVKFDLEKAEQNKGFNPFKQMIYVNTHKDEKAIKSALKIKAKSKSLLSSDYIFNNIPKRTFTKIQELSNKKIPVDLLIFNCKENELNNANTFEIKMGGNLDTKNSKSNAEEVKTLAELFGFLENNASFFATCYGECSHAVASEVEKIIGEAAILNNEKFWEKIIPTQDGSFTYDEFIDEFKKAFSSSNLEKELEEL